MTSLVTDLKPCPFCGGDKLNITESVYEPTKELVCAVTCRTRDCHGAIYMMGYGLFRTHGDAIAAWNTRAESAESQLARCRDALEFYAVHRRSFSKDCGLCGAQSEHRDDEPMHKPDCILSTSDPKGPQPIIQGSEK
jgi:Lar family restriction alleviation protein